MGISEALPAVMLTAGVFAQVFFKSGSLVIWLSGMQFASQIFSYLRLWYCITPEKRLLIKNGWFFFLDIDVKDIISVAPSRVRVDSPAMAMDGFEISYSRNKKVHVTPRKANEFVRSLLAANPDIELVKMEKYNIAEPNLS